ncbi:MAG: hypothetical protein JWM58_897 [Rhizobium sp.]|nr:hypothetical protein [Rhizobium sp.]
MTLYSKLRACVLAALAGLIFTASAASAAEVTFVMKNSHPNAVEVELYSQDRNHVWPGGGEIYLLDDGETKTMALSCQDGEKICYGAWISGDKSTYWGRGPGGTEGCEDCCYTCAGGNTEEIDLGE